MGGIGSPAFFNSRGFGCGLLAAMVLAFFGDLLFGAHDRVVSRMGTDIYRQFAGWRFFGFAEIAKGNFPFWTPLVYGGMPYFSGFQSALLYPPNYLFLVLPLEKAINWGVALHVWWLGAGMYLWMRSAGLRQAAALFAGVLLMFCAPYFLHIFAGHLTNLCVMAWAPWLMMVISRWRVENRVCWVLLGGMFVAMQIFAGHPQYVYYGAIAAGVYAVLLFFANRENRWRFTAGIAAIFVMGGLLAAVQVLPGLEATGESMRGGGTGKAFAGSYSFPPENLLTMLAPGIFGAHRSGSPYWGRWFYWEMAAFFTVSGLWCAAIGAVWGKQSRATWIAAVICVLLALGSYTPLFHVMYAVVPGYDLFRGNSKFMFFGALFAVALAGMGLDRLLAGEKMKRERVLLICGGVVAALAATGAMVAGTGGGLWGSFRGWLWESGEVTHLAEQAYFSGEFAAQAAKTGSRALWIAAGMLAVVTGLTGLRGRVRYAIYGIVVLGLIEAIAFAAKFRNSFALSTLRPGLQMQVRADQAGDYRAADVTMANGGMLSGIPDLWGDDPGLMKRYAEFMAVTQGVHPDHANQHLRMQKTHKRWELLRFRHLFTPTKEGARHQRFEGEPMKRFELVPGYEVVAGRDAVFAVLFREDFNPRKTVLLEEPPLVHIHAGGEEVNGSWVIEREDTDEVLVRVSVDRPCVLLMTDPYGEGWRVEKTGGDAAQSEYAVMPADYILRGIPLQAGEHVLRIYYRPKWFVAGAAVSGVTGLAWVVVFVVGGRRGTG